MYQLRGYQEQVITNVMAYFARDKDPAHNPVVDMAVGAGKSIVIAELVNRIMTMWPEQRILMLVHVKELVEQNLDKAVTQWNGAIGVHSAALNRKDVEEAVIFGSIQSLYRKAERLGHFDLVIIDEVHTISKEASKGMYRTFLEGLKKINPKIRLLGFTGTPYRLQGGLITRGKERLFTDICYSLGVGPLLEQGYLVPLITPDMDPLIRMDGVRVTAGDYNLKDIAGKVDQPAIVEKAAAQIVELAQHRKKWLIFCANIEHAAHVEWAIAQYGISVKTVTGKTKPKDRAAILHDFKHGSLRAVCNVGVLTTGFDFPELDCGILLRPTQSLGLFVQITGRFLRPAPGKENALWLDFTDTTERLGPIDQIIPPPAREPADGDPIFKLCPECAEMCAPVVKHCPVCGYEFPIEEKEPHGSKASNASIIGSRPDIHEVKVDGVMYSKYLKAGKPPTMLVTYMCGLMEYREWIAIEGQPFARRKAASWWCERSDTALPASVDDALLQILALREPTRLQVDLGGKYPDILAYKID